MSHYQYELNKLNKLIKYCKAGNIDEAETIYKQVIKRLPQDKEVIRSLNAALHELGILYISANQQDKVLACYKKIIEINPSDASAYNNLGVYFHNNNEEDTAIAFYLKTIEQDPNFVDAYKNLAMVYDMKNDSEKAILCYQKLLELNPKNPELFNNLGITLFNKNNIDMAMRYYKRAIALKPDYADPYNNLGIAFYNQGEKAKAVMCYQKAIQVNRSYADPYNNLGIFYLESKQIEKAIKCFVSAINIKPDYASPYNNIGITLYEDNEIEEAAKYYQKALSFDPYYVDAYKNRGMALFELGQIEEAQKCYEKAIELNPNNNDIRFCLGILQLSIGNFKEGWKGYEYRPPPSVSSFLESHKWDASSLDNKTIYIYNEQGLGDSIHFIRYLPVLASMNAKVLFKPFKELYQLYKQSSELKADLIDVSVPDESLEVDFTFPIASLPYIFKTNASNVPLTDKYLSADPEKVNFYKEKYFNNDKFKVGIFWQGNAEFAKDKNRSAKLQDFYKLAEIPNIKLYSLQKGYGSEQLQNVPENIQIEDVTESFNDFSDTAAVIENLDLVISVDTAVAHLSGALGKPTWIMLAATADWRWALKGKESMWYKSVRLFRKTDINNWNSVMDEIYQELSPMLG